MHVWNFCTCLQCCAINYVEYVMRACKCRRATRVVLQLLAGKGLDPDKPLEIELWSSENFTRKRHFGQHFLNSSFSKTSFSLFFQEHIKYWYLSSNMNDWTTANAATRLLIYIFNKINISLFFNIKLWRYSEIWFVQCVYDVHVQSMCGVRLRPPKIEDSLTTIRSG